ncbi:MAG: putative transport protein [Patiriisocius sp.]|jgi:predicted transport protein
MYKALQTMIDNMPEKTGKSLDQWKKILKGKSFEKHGEAMTFLKGEHGVTHGFSNTIIHLSKEDEVSSDDLVTNQYKGKEDLLPIFEKLRAMITSFGKDIIITPKKGSVSFIRKRQFALIKPATKSRIDLGLKIKDKEITSRLENSGSFGTMCTHRVQLTEISDVDSELEKWLLEAYEKSI